MNNTDEERNQQSQRPSIDPEIELPLEERHRGQETCRRSKSRAKQVQQGNQDQSDLERLIESTSAPKPDSQLPSPKSTGATNMLAYEFRSMVLEEFDRRTWQVIETALSIHITHLIDGIGGGFGLIIEGPSGCGKSTTLRAFETAGLQPQFYRSDDITPASFVSHDVSKSEEELQRDDLLPTIRGKTILNPEMANWFAGD